MGWGDNKTPAIEGGVCRLSKRAYTSNSLLEEGVLAARDYGECRGLGEAGNCVNGFVLTEILPALSALRGLWIAGLSMIYCV